LEYRTPSSAILAHPVLFHLCFELARFAVGYGRTLVSTFWAGGDDRDVAEVVNTLDVGGAKSMFKANQNLFHELLVRRWGTSNGRSEAVEKLITVGALEWFGDGLENMAANWRLEHDQYRGYGSPPKGAWLRHAGAESCSVMSMSAKARRGGCVV